MFFALTAFAMMFAACQKEENSPTVSFENAFPVTSDGTATLTLNVTGYTGTEPVTIPVTFTTEAVEGEDYEVSAKEFVYGGASPVTTISVTAKRTGIGKDITATLEIPNGFKAGQYPVCAFSLDKVGYLSFDSKNADLKQSCTLTVNIVDENGKNKKLETADKINITVDVENSTAIEGTNFEFDGEKAVTIDAGKSSGSTTIRIIGDTDNDHNKLILKLDLGEKYNAGQNITCTVNILGSDLKKMEGKWVINELITDKDWMATENYLADMGYDLEEQLGKYPEFNSEDTITFDLANNIFTPSFKSDFKNYFTGTSAIEPAGEVIFREMTTKNNIEMFRLDNINRYFSSTQTSKDKTALVGMNIITDDNKELLVIYIIDYEPKDFCNFLYDFYINPEVSPTCATGGPNTLTREAVIRMTFRKAE